MLSIDKLQSNEDIQAIVSSWTTQPSSDEEIWPQGLLEWNESYRKHLQPNDQAFLYAHIIIDSQQFLIPLVESTLRKRGLKLKTLSFPYHDHSQFAEIITTGAVNKSTLKHLQTAILSLGKDYDCLYIPALPEDSLLKRCLEDADTKVCEVYRSHCDIINLNARQSSEDLVSKNFRNNLRKSQKKFQALEGLEIETSRNAKRLQVLFDEFLAVEASGWKGISGTNTAINLDQSLVRFYRDLVENSGQGYECEISVIRLENKAISAQFSIISNTTQYMLKIGYDEAFEKLAPGRYHMRCTMDQLLSERTIKQLNLMSDASWHNGWNPQQVATYSAFIKGTTMKGRLFILLMRIRRSRKLIATLALLRQLIFRTKKVFSSQ